MKLFFQKRWLMAFCLLIQLTVPVLYGAQGDYPGKPERPLILESFRNLIISADKAGLPSLLESLTGFTHLVNLLHTAGKPETMIIPASGRAAPI